MTDEKTIRRLAGQYVPGCRGRGGCGCEEDEGVAPAAASWPSQADGARALARRIEEAQRPSALVAWAVEMTVLHVRLA